MILSRECGVEAVVGKACSSTTVQQIVRPAWRRSRVQLEYSRYHTALAVRLSDNG